MKTLANLTPQLIIEGIDKLSPLIKSDEMIFAEVEVDMTFKDSGNIYSGKHICLADTQSEDVQAIIGKLHDEESEALTVLLAVLYNNKELIKSALEQYESYIDDDELVEISSQEQFKKIREEGTNKSSCEQMEIGGRK